MPPDDPTNVPINTPTDPPADPAPQKDPPASPPDPAEERLKAILGVQEEITKKVDQQGAFNDQVLQAISGLTQKIDALQTPKPSPVDPGFTPSPTPSPPPAPSPTPAGPENLAKLVRDAVQQALAPQQEQQARIQKHQESFQKVAQQYPELTDPTSRDAQIFNKIYRSRGDLHKLDDAPSVIAEITRGLRAQERAQERQTEQRKVQATLPIGRGRGIEVNTDQDVRTLQEQYNQLRERGRKVPLTRRELGDLLNLTTALQHLGRR